MLIESFSSDMAIALTKFSIKWYPFCYKSFDVLCVLIEFELNAPDDSVELYSN